MPADQTKLDLLVEEMTRIEAALSLLVEQHTSKEWCSVEEVAVVLRRRPYTVREHRRLGRIRARKRECGRGQHGEWSISPEERTHVVAHGLRRLRFDHQKPDDQKTPSAGGVFS